MHDLLQDLIRDLRVSLRLLARSPGFTAAAIVCLALGIGANTAVFSFANALFFRRPPVAEPERLARAFISWQSGLQYGSFSVPDFRDVREQNRVFSGFVAAALAPLQISADGRNERLWGALVSADYFAVLGVEIPLGRGFLPEEDGAPGEHPVVVMSHGLWQRRFGADPGIVGRGLTLNGRPFTVVGVAPAGFYGTDVGLRADLWVPLAMQAVAIPGETWLEQRGSHWLNGVFGRLAPGVTLEQAQADLDAIMARLTAAYPDTNAGIRAVLYPGTEAGLHPMVRDSFAGFLGLMFGVVGLVLLLACANVAGLLLARAAGRRREIAVRLAIGAGRGRLLRQLLTESLLLAAAAGVAGLLAGAWLVSVLGSLEPPVDFPLWLDLELDPAVLAFTTLAALATGILFGLVPALQASRPELVSALKEAGFAAAGRASRLRRGLVVGQVSLSLVLLIGAGLVLRSFANARHIDVGFEPERQLIAGVDVGLQGYAPEAGEEFFRALKERVEALPGVEVVGWAEVVPLSINLQQTNALPEGHVVPAGGNEPTIDFNVVGPGYFEAMGVRLLRGRGFEPADADGPPVVVVNQTFARRYWGEEDPLGKTVRVYGDVHRVAGVAADGKYFSLGEDPKPYLYLPVDRYYQGRRTLHVRSAGDPAALAPAVRREIRRLDATLPVCCLETMADRLGFVLFPAELAAWVTAVFAALALLLAAVGLYGVVAYWVSQGIREIGIRMALGAGAREVEWLVVRQGMTLVAAGLAVGLGVGYVLSRLLATLLYGVSATDPAAYLAAAAVLAAAAFAASLLPARRASRVAPVEALRAE